MANEFLPFKVVVIGDPRVGKSSLVSRFTCNYFTHEYRPTGITDFCIRRINVGDKLVRAQIWVDGTARHRINPPDRTISYYRHAVGALLVYDITRYDTYENARRWLKELRDHTDPDIVVMLVGNKTDLGQSRVVATEEAEAFAEREKMLFMETSALDSINVESSFSELLSQIRLVKERVALIEGFNARLNFIFN